MYYNKEGYTLYYEKYGQGENKILILPGWEIPEKLLTVS